ncbi:MAG: DMT family transporter [Halobacteriales archaeon]
MVSRFRSILAFATLAVLWGLSVTAVEIGLEGFPPLLFAAFRYDAAGVLLLAYVMWSYSRWRPRTRGDLIAISGGGLFWIAVGNGVWFVGQGLTTSVVAGLITSLIPIATTAVSWVALPEDRLRPAAVVGLLVSFVGAMLLFWPTGSAAVRAALLGKGLLFVAVLGTAVGGVLIRLASAELPRPGQTAWSVLVGAVIIHALSLLAGESWSLGLTAASVGALAYLAVPGTVAAYLLFFSLFDDHSAIEISLVTYVVPVVAAVAGWLALGEPVTAQLMLGFAVIVVGFALMKRQALAAEFGTWR